MFNTWPKTPYAKVTKKKTSHPIEPVVSPLQAGDPKTARNRQHSIIKTNVKHKYQTGSTKKRHLGSWVSKTKMVCLNMFNGTTLKALLHFDQIFYT